MFFRKHKPMDEGEFADVIARLRDERREPTPLELDEIKTRALRQATRRRGPATTGASMRRTLIVGIATLSLMLSGTGAVLAGKDDNKSKGDDKGDNGDNKDKNAGKKQYSHCNKSGNTHSGSAQSASSQQNNCPQPPPSQSQQGSHGSQQNQGNDNGNGNDQGDNGDNGG